MTTPLTNTVEGRINIAAASEDLAVGYLAKIDANRQAALAGTTTDPVAARFVVVDSDEDSATLLPIEPGRQVRVVLSGVCACGDQLAGTAAGKAITLADGAAGSCPILVAEENGVDGQLVLCRGLAAYVKPDPADELPEIASGDASKMLTVKSDESGVEWTTPPVAAPAIGTGDAAKVLAVKSDESGLEYVDKHGLTAAAGSAGDVYGSVQNGEAVDTGWQSLLAMIQTIAATLPTSDPNTLGALWVDTMNGNVLKVSIPI